MPLIKAACALSMLAALATGAGPSFAASPPPQANDQRCSNAFVLTQVTDQYSAKSAGVHEAYEFPAGQASPKLVHRMELPALLGNAVYLCEQRLMAAVVSDPRLKPYGRLDIEEVRPDRTELPAPTWWQRTTGRLPDGRQRYLTEGATEFVLVLNGKLLVHDNALRLIPTASAPAGWRFSGPFNETAMFPGKDGSPAVSTTELIHFDPVSREVVGRVPMSASCKNHFSGTPLSFEFCKGDHSVFAVNFKTGERSLYVEQDSKHPYYEAGRAVPVPSQWWAKGRLIFMNARQVADDLVIPRDIYAVTSLPGGRSLERLGRVPSETIEYVQGTPDGLILVSAKERRIWLFDPENGTSTSAPLKQLRPGARISAISHTADHVLVAERIDSANAPTQSRLHILDRQLRPVHVLERPGRTLRVTTTARPWMATVNFDGLHLIPYPGKTVGR